MGWWGWVAEESRGWAAACIVRPCPLLCANILSSTCRPFLARACHQTSFQGLACACRAYPPSPWAPIFLQSSLMGASLTLPIQHGRLALGTWQGIYLNEHRREVHTACQRLTVGTSLQAA